MDETQRTTDADPAISTAAVAALRRGNKIEAIKIVRIERSIGLKEAKDAVEDYVDSQPALKSSLAEAQSETKRSAVVWIAVLAGLAILAYYFLARR